MGDPIAVPLIGPGLGMVFDHEAEIEDMGMVFQAVVYAITAEQWRSGTGEGLY